MTVKLPDTPLIQEVPHPKVVQSQTVLMHLAAAFIPARSSMEDTILHCDCGQECSFHFAMQDTGHAVTLQGTTGANSASQLVPALGKVLLSKCCCYIDTICGCAALGEAQALQFCHAVRLMGLTRSTLSVWAMATALSAWASTILPLAVPAAVHTARSMRKRQCIIMAGCSYSKACRFWPHSV
jgi:hypothetical protein